MATLGSSLAAIESLLRPAHPGRGDEAGAHWPLRFAAAAETANRLLGPEQLARVIVELSDESWAELGDLRRAAGEALRAGAPAGTAFGQLLRVDDRVWAVIARFRGECRAAGGARDAALHAVALGAIRAAVTPPRKRTITSAARAERGDGDEPRMEEAQEAVGRSRARVFLENYRRIRAASAEHRPELRTQKGLAAAAGVSAATVNGIETGKVLPHLGTVLKLAKALGVPAEMLLAGR